MLKTEITNNNAWANLHKIVFRFFFIYFLLYIAPWTWIFDLPIPGFETISNFYSACIDWFVNAANKYFFHVRPVLVPTNGSGDTSFGWAQVCLFLSLAIFGTTVWTLLNIRRKNYTLLDYWFRTIIRYNLAMIAMGYGLAKVFLSQMSFPTESLLSTNLGDLLPMRLSWLFIGYSAPYEIFAGVMEIIAAVLLLNRKTITFGLFVATGVFIHVMVLNLCYDIPVKIFSIHLVLYCLYLLANDFKRLWNFLVINKTTPPNTLYELRLDTKRKRIYRIVIKTLIIAAFFIFPFWTSLTGFLERDLKNKKSIFGEGIYNVQTFVLNNKDTIPILARDTLVWKDIIFPKKFGSGSIGSRDTVFLQSYGRGYFSYKTDTVNHTLLMIKKSNFWGDSVSSISARYAIIDSNKFKLWTKIRNDSVYVEFVKSNRHFQLAERQFHWLSEYNR